MTTVRRRKLVQMGSSCGLTIPADLCAAHGMSVGKVVDIVETARGLLLKPTPTAARMTLQERITKSSVNAVRSAGQELRDAPAVGRELP